MDLFIPSVQSEEMRQLLAEIDVDGDDFITDYDVQFVVPNDYVDLTNIPPGWSYDEFRKMQNVLYENHLIGRRYDLPQLISAYEFNPSVLETRETVELEGEDFCGSVIFVRNWHTIRTDPPQAGGFLGIVQQLYIYQLLEGIQTKHLFMENQRWDSPAFEHGRIDRIETAEQARQIFPGDLTPFNIWTDEGLPLTVDQMRLFVEAGYRVYAQRHPSVSVHRTITPEEFRQIYGSDDIASADISKDESFDNAPIIMDLREAIATREVYTFLQTNPRVKEVWFVYGALHEFVDDFQFLRCRPSLITLDFPVVDDMLDQFHDLAKQP